MDRELVEQFLELIEAMIARESAHDTSDGGLIESVRYNELKKEFLEKVDAQANP